MENVLKILEGQYRHACSIPSDINQHLPVLKNIANEVNHVTEMGVRDGQSTRAFLNSPCILRSYDLYKDSFVESLFELARSAGLDKTYEIADTRNLDIEQTDALFIDTDHNYHQLKAELDLHHSKVNKYIMFHDTLTFAGPGNGITCKIGLVAAILEFLAEHSEWNVFYHSKDNNGLTILKKR